MLNRSVPTNRQRASAPFALVAALGLSVTLISGCASTATACSEYP